MESARSHVAADNVEFIRCGGEELNFSGQTFDIVIYTLSLHHIPIDAMQRSLEQAAGLLREEGRIVVIEPGAGGTLIEAEERFGVGDGDERRQKAVARSALDALDGWDKERDIRF